MTLTDHVWIGVIIFMLIYDIWAATVSKTPNDTLSEVVWKASLNRPIIPFLAGVVCGHFFWQFTK